MPSRNQIAALFISLQMETVKLDKQLNSTQKKLRKWGNDMSRVGSGLTKAISLPLAAAAVATAKFSVEMNKSMANVATLIPGNIQRVKALKGEVQDLAKSSGKSTKDLSDGLYQVISAFGDSEDSAKKLKIATEASIAGLANTTDSINLLSAVTKGYGDTTISATKKTADFAFQTVKLGQTTFPELASSIGKVIPMAKALGVSQQEVWAVMATGTGVVGNTSEVATKLQGVMAALQKPTGKLKDLFKEWGIESGETLVQQHGLVGTLQLVANEAKRAGIPLAQYFKRVEATTLALALSGAQAETFAKKMGLMGQSAGAMKDALKEQTEGINKLGFQFEQAQQAMIVAMQKVGDHVVNMYGPAIIGTMKSVATSVEAVADAFDSLPEFAQQLIGIFTAVTVVVGPVLVGLGALAKLAGTKLVLAFALLFAKIGIVVAIFGTLILQVKGLIDEFGNLVLASKAAVRALAWRNLKHGPIDAYTMALRELAIEQRDQNKAAEEAYAPIKKVTDYVKDKATGVWDQFKIGLAKVTDKWKELQAAEEEKLRVEKKAEVERKKNAEQGVKDLKELEKQHRQTVNRIKQDSLRKALQISIEDMDMASFETISVELEKAIEEGAMIGFEKMTQYSGEAGKKWAKGIASLEAKQEMEGFFEEMADIQLEYDKKVYEEGVDFWRKTFENAITGVKFDLEDMLKQVAVGFAAEVMQGLTGSLGSIFGGSGGPQGLGGQLGQIILGTIGGGGPAGAAGGAAGGMGSGMGGIGQIGAAYSAYGTLANVYANWGAFQAGYSGTVGAAGIPYAGGAQVAAQQGSTIGSAAPYLGYAAAAYMNYTAMSDIGKSRGANVTAGTTAAGTAAGAYIGTAVFPGLGTAVGAALGSVLGYAAGQIGGKAFGLFGTRDKDTMARQGMVDEFNRLIKETVGAIVVPNESTGQLQSISKIWPGDVENKFNDDSFTGPLTEEFGPELVGQFTSVGDAMANLLDVGRDVGAQIGFILLEQMGGNVNGLRELVAMLGLDLQQMEEHFVSMGMQGEMTWHEVEVNLQNVNKALGDGLVGVGDFTGAFKALIMTGGQGAVALKKLKDVAVEAMEAGKGFEQVKQEMLASGEFTEEEVTALFEAMAQRGVNSWEELLAASDRVAGGIVADMESLGIPFEAARQKLEALTEGFNTMQEKIDSIAASDPEIDVSLNLPSNWDELQRIEDLFNIHVSASPKDTGGNIEEHAKGGLITTPHLGLVGEAGPEAIMPVGRMANGQFGVKMAGGVGRPMQVVYNVEASDASQGSDILEALEAIEDRAVERAVDMVEGMTQRSSF